MLTKGISQAQHMYPTLKLGLICTQNLNNNKEERYTLYLDYQIPVTQINGDMQSASEIKMRHLPAVDWFKRYGR